MLILQDVMYKHPNQDVLFSGLDMTVHSAQKIALVGNNGAGKSTLLRLVAGELPLTSGSVFLDVKLYYVPQLFGQFDHLTVAQALRIDQKLTALQQILRGEVSDENMHLLDDDWSIEERSREALAYWQLNDVDLMQPLSDLSGGQKTKVFLAGIAIHQPELVLLDEPSNHLDMAGRGLLYDYITHTKNTLLVVSHDRALLNLLDQVFELNRKTITAYGGDYEFYRAQKAIGIEALHHDLHSKEKALRKAKQVERESIERQQKLDARGKKKQAKAGLPTISMNTFRNNAERSTARMKGVHEEKVDGASKELDSLRKQLPGADKMKMDFDDSSLHKGKRLVVADELNFRYADEWLWATPLSFQINSGERVAIRGDNGSGKTTLVRLLLGELVPSLGSLQNSASRMVYIDQEYSLIDNSRNVYHQAQKFNTGSLSEHEVKSRLTKFLFDKDNWDRPCAALSGGERMRLVLCCLTLDPIPPDIIILDEPTNNLDLQNVEILTNAVNDYNGTLIVISHDAYFLEQVNVTGLTEL
ncbi:ATP-binding cassette domain-containing protein [Terrimonas sp. NA20]|uniref:ATP-binding cassette domain-containing protein n=1 Tax=Terrimonas ginsenosidimutans TaxID=2908004 RepID=A0ABS9KZF9_9BACT|nr:ABC-F family ATP-binding cassette domain-containing protein [Terrimonas ginsenosidimutans]MCG2617774.1 ATP-binding cassette domain-containing protein [Terrimonas ginsenosidimutans]